MKRVVLLVWLVGCYRDAPAPPPSHSSEPVAVDPAPPRSRRHRAEPADAVSLTGIEPPNGDANGGTYCRIRGTHFLTDDHGAIARLAQVRFGASAGTIIRFANDDELIVEAPGGTPGDVVDVVVTFDPGGEHTLDGAFTFVTKP